ncbi:hypothetical protein [uncultured Pseudokineococcus sp.]|uniref:hypothetical protein n=1 Tax=uncultured Pseudokineococcus sp. TaxID=1642928 RepID=UPI0026074F8D|nr:hypothetical protein [uncultured Pseudokineococcus sp.]
MADRLAHRPADLPVEPEAPADAPRVPLPRGEVATTTAPTGAVGAPSLPRSGRAVPAPRTAGPLASRRGRRAAALAALVLVGALLAALAVAGPDAATALLTAGLQRLPGVGPLAVVALVGAAAATAPGGWRPRAAAVSVTAGALALVVSVAG